MCRLNGSPRCCVGIARSRIPARAQRSGRIGHTRQAGAAALLGLAGLLVLVLAACDQTSKPASSATITPTAVLPTSLAAASPSPTTEVPFPPAPTPSSLPSRNQELEPGTPWPRFLRELNFAIPAGNSYGPHALAIHPGLDRVYARTRGPDGVTGAEAPGRVTVLDRTSGRVLAIAETGPDSYGEGTLAIDTERNLLYTVNPGETTGSVLDAETCQTLTTLQGVDRLALDPESGRIYVAGLASLRVLEPTTYTVLKDVPVSYAPQFLALAVNPARDRVLVAYQDSTGHFVGQYDSTTLQELAVTDLPGQPVELVPDPNRDRVYVTLNDGEHSLWWSLDGEGQLVQERVLGDWTQTTQLALDPAGDRLFLGYARYYDYGIAVLNPESGQELATIPLELAPNALTWDAEAGQLWVSHTYSDKISVVEVETGRTTATFPTALDLVDLAVDPQRGRVYLTDSAGRLHIVDSETDEELATLPGEGYIAVDPPHGRLYTGGAQARRVRIYDADSLQQTGEIQTRAKPVADTYHGYLYLVGQGVYLASLETMTFTMVITDTLPKYPGWSPNPAAVDAVVDSGSGRVFAIINNGIPGSNGGTYLYVYEPDTYQKVLTDTERSPTWVDVDPTTGWAYISRIHMAGRSTSLLRDGREYTARLDAVYGALRVDPGLGYVYLTASGYDDGYLFVLEAENLNVLGSVPIPGRFQLLALDPQRHLLYLASEDGRVQIWSATGGELAAPARPTTTQFVPEGIYQLFRGPDDRPLFAGSLYRSDDEGRSWQRINKGLPQRGVQEVVVSPDFARDETLFAVPVATDEGFGIWKSVDGGLSWRTANRGLSDLAVIDLAISPNFAVDGTLFATARRGGLFRSRNGGENWVRLTDRYQPVGTYPQPPGSVFVSPTYAQDRTVFAVHYGLQRSTDGGETWVRLVPKLSSLAISPNFAVDHTLFGWGGDGGVLRSTDGGDTWQGASVGLALAEFGSGRVIVSPDFSTRPTVYFEWMPSSPDAVPQFYRSLYGAATWEQLAGEPPQATTPVELSADGTTFMALNGAGGVLRWPVDDLPWRPAALPPVGEIAIQQLIPSAEFIEDHTLFALTEGMGILRSVDVGLTWTDTGFPLRMTHILPRELVVLPPQTLWIGTSLGLYRSENAVTWAVAGGGLPPGATISSPQIGPDGSLRVLVSGQREDEGGRVFLSTDGGQTWRQPIPTLPQAVDIGELRLSPALASEPTAFFLVSYDRPWRTVDGGEWQPFGPPGTWQLSAMQISPAFDQDKLLFLRLHNNRLWRSTDGGDEWTDVSGPWGGEAPTSVVRGTGATLDALTFSPAFGQDGVILTQAGSSLYRSTDQGTTWTDVLELEPFFVQAVFSPGYSQDGTIYILQSRELYRSTDRGKTWQMMPAAPWSELDEVTLLLSPTVAQDRTLLVWTRAGRVYQSRDGGQFWHDISRGLPQVSIRQVLFSPAFVTDGLIYLVPQGPGLYTRVGESPWITSAEAAAPPTPAPPPTRVPRSLPTPTPVPTACAGEPVQFSAVWQQAHTRLGCPAQLAEEIILAEQAFEHGRMIWDSSTRQIYILNQAGTWRATADTFVEGVDPAYDPTLPPPPQQPQRGFGKVWREQLGGPGAAIGWALENERGVSGWRQRFDRGLLVWTDATLVGSGRPGTAYLLYDNGTWQAISTPSP